MHSEIAPLHMSELTEYISMFTVKTAVPQCDGLFPRHFCGTAVLTMYMLACSVSSFIGEQSQHA